MHRKKPFSAKQKKKQLQEKREHKQTRHDLTHQRLSRAPKHKEFGGNNLESDDDSDAEVHVVRLNEQSSSSGTYDPNRYKLHFAKETKKELQQRKEESMQPLHFLPETACEMSFEDTYRPGSALDMPKRPLWDYKLSKEKLDDNEQKYFKEYVETIFSQHEADKLSYFELNLETWRQLWRVLEISDIVLMITDIRYPVIHFSPALYNYVTKDLNKSIILVLNKIDLAPPGVVVAWKHYLHHHYPQLNVVCFTSQPKTEVERFRAKHRRKVKRSPALGPAKLLQACERIVGKSVDLRSWRRKIEEIEIHRLLGPCDEDSSDDEDDRSDSLAPVDLDTSYEHHEKYKNGVLTIGCIGYPNVGKSSLINSLNVKKVVSVSRTPGHTKHFQTIFLTPTVRLCDCPGLVFPSLVPKSLQVLAGMYPISQVREPYSVVQYLAERVDLPRVLRLNHLDEDSTTWSAFDICDAWADKRGYRTAKAARPDTYRAANSILRYALEGAICLCMKPPGYALQNDDWLNHLETMEISYAQTVHCRTIRRFSREVRLDFDSDDSDDSEPEMPSNLNPFALLANE